MEYGRGGPEIIFWNIPKTKPQTPSIAIYACFLAAGNKTYQGGIEGGGGSERIFGSFWVSKFLKCLS